MDVIGVFATIEPDEDGFALTEEALRCMADCAPQTPVTFNFMRDSDPLGIVRAAWVQGGCLFMLADVNDILRQAREPVYGFAAYMYSTPDRPCRCIQRAELLGVSLTLRCQPAHPPLFVPEGWCERPCES